MLAFILLAIITVIPGSNSYYSDGTTIWEGPAYTDGTNVWIGPSECAVGLLQPSNNVIIDLGRWIKGYDCPNTDSVCVGWEGLPDSGVCQRVRGLALTGTLNVQVQ